MKKRLQMINSLLVLALLSCARLMAATQVVTIDITGNTTWYGTNEYLLNTVVYVQSNAVLTIEPGTVIKGGTNAANLVSRPGLPNLVSALWVTRGGKLYATGTVDKPIIFTMEGDNVNDPNDLPPTMTGQWGGVVVMGRATINSAQYATGGAATPKYDVYEGVDLPPQKEHIFGGNDDEDSSGALRYVSIRHSGNTFAPAKELNALTMGAVGRGTTIEYVEVFAGSDDGFEWWGGTVNTRYLVAAFMEDDDFDTDQGYRGTNQFWFGIKPPWQGSSDSRGIESDGDLNQNTLGDAVPFSEWRVDNLTLIGRGASVQSYGGGSAWNARDEAAPNVRNSVVVNFNKGLLLDVDGLFHWTNATVRASALNNVWDVVTNSATSAGLFVFTNGAFGNTVEAAKLGAISFTNDVATLDPRPQPDSPALSNVLPGAPVQVAYRGAFSPNDNWADGWTGLSSMGYMVTNNPSVTPPEPPAMNVSTAGGSLSFSFISQPGYTYVLESTPVLVPATWTNVATVVGNGEALSFSPVAATNTTEYFRIRAH